MIGVRRKFRRDDGVRTKRYRYGTVAGNMGTNIMGEYLYGVRWDSKPDDIVTVCEDELIQTRVWHRSRSTVP